MDVDVDVRVPVVSNDDDGRSTAEAGDTVADVVRWPASQPTNQPARNDEIRL